MGHESEIEPGADPGIDLRRRWSESERFVPRAVVQPVQRLLAQESASAGLLLGAAIVALIWANSPWHESYARLWETPFDVQLGASKLVHLELSLRDVVNDALMTLFFYVAALEIKRELVFGDLRDRRAAALPAIAALGGMLAPAAVFALVVAGGDGASGWGIPMATDIAFAVAVVTLLGRRVPLGARTFLLTLAIVDDIGGIVVIAVFYTDGLAFGWLAFAGAAIAAMWAAQRVHIRSYGVYMPLAITGWYAMHESGVHAAIAGVLIGLVTPAWSFHNPQEFAGAAQPLLDRVAAAFDDDKLTHTEVEDNEGALRDLVRLSVETSSPLERHEYLMSGPVTLLVVPLFALANAGVRVVGGGLGNPFTDRLVVAVALALVIGKTIGISVASFVAVRLGLGRLPHGVNWRMVVGLAATGGVGFTVALFIANLSFEQPELVDRAKVGILAGSVLAGVAGYLLLRAAASRSGDRTTAG